MNITMKCLLNGKEYVFSTNNRMSVVSCRCITTGRSITSDKTLAAVLSACIEVAHAEAMEFNDATNCVFVYAPGYSARSVWVHLTPVEREVSLIYRHAEALEMNARLDAEYSRINAMVPDEASKPRFYTVASHFIVGCPKLPAIE